MFQDPKKINSEKNSLPFSNFLNEVDAGRVVEVQIKGNNISGILADGSSFKTYSPNYPELVDKLSSKGVSIVASPLEDKMPSLLGILLSWFPMLLLIGVWIFFMRQMQGGKGGAMGFGRSKAKLLNEAQGKVTFNDVAGVEEAKEEVEEIVEFLKDPKKFSRLGGKIPKGALLIGPPGTGKTLLAKAIAGEANVPFFSISGSDFVEMFVGVGASRIRELFELAKKNKPCIIFIDEIDAVGRSRSSSDEKSNAETQSTLNELLVGMDGYKSSDGIFIIGATNRADLLDSALLRPGRIDKRVYIGNPDLKTREAILNIHLKGKPRSGKVDVDNLKELTNGLSGAQIENLLNEAMLLALRNDREIMVMEDIESILSRILVGYQSSENSYSTNMIKRIAIHEMGHAIVGILSLDHAKLVKVCLNVWSPTSPGYTIFENAEVDSNIYTKEKLLSRLMVLLSGRIAEEVFFGESITSGASKDIEEAYKLAEQMIVKFGMGSKIVYPQHSEDSKNYIDKDIEKLIESTYQEAYTIIMNCKNIIEECSNELIKNQILIPEKIYDIMKKYNVNK